MKRTIHMETTEVSVDKTINAIQVVLKGNGMRRFNLMYGDDGEIEAVHFTIIARAPGHNVGQLAEMPYKLPARHEALLELADRGETRYLKRGDTEQARRVAWRQILRWVEAQIALIQLEMVKIEEVFLPYLMIDENETTLYEKMMDTGFQGFLLSEGEK